MLEKFGRQFPKTREMSAFARTQVEVDISRPDEAVVGWLEREGRIIPCFRARRHQRRLKEGFASVDIFIAYSLSVQNRRKARMGFALQNHLAELFTQHKLKYTAQARTEANNRPDFIFPGEQEYNDATFDAAVLVMLGVKSTSKDRWRQVLTEADRIPNKHLCTLGGGHLHEADRRDASAAPYFGGPRESARDLYRRATGSYSSRRRFHSFRPPESECLAMPDVFTSEKRSIIMSRIRATGNRDTELRMITLFRT